MVGHPILQSVETGIPNFILTFPPNIPVPHEEKFHIVTMNTNLQRVPARQVSRSYVISLLYEHTDKQTHKRPITWLLSLVSKNLLSDSNFSHV